MVASLLRPLILALALALVGACTRSEGAPKPVPVDLARPLLLRAVVDPDGALARVAEAVRADPGAGLAVEEALVGATGRPVVQELVPTGPSRQALEDYVKGHPELAAPAGFTFAYEEIDERTEARRWRLHCLREAGGLDLRRLAGAEVHDDMGIAQVRVHLSPEDGEAFGRLTGELVGARVAVVHGGEVLMAPMVQEPITGGVFSINLASGATEAEAEAALKRLLAR